MIKKILNNQLFKNSFVYVFADVVNKAIPFLLLPVLTRYLTPVDYGVLATFMSFVSAMGIFMGLSTTSAVSVQYFKMPKSELAQYIGNVLYILGTTFLIGLLVLLAFHDLFVEKLEIPLIWLILGVVLTLSRFITLLNLSILQVENKSILYGSIQILETLLKVGFSLLFIIIYLLSWKGRIMGMLTGGVIITLMSLIILYKSGFIRLVYKKEYLKDALNFGVPLVPQSLAYWFRTGGIILLIAYLVGKKETGLYSVATMFVIPISVLTLAFNKAWVPFLFKKLSASPSKIEKIKIVKFSYLYFTGLIVLAGLLALIAPFVIKFMLDKEYHNAYIFIVYLAFGEAFRGMFLMVYDYYLFEKKTKIIGKITIVVSIIHIFMAYFLIKANGAIGAAQSFLITMIISFLTVWYYSNKVYKMPWFLKK